MGARVPLVFESAESEHIQRSSLGEMYRARWVGTLSEEHQLIHELATLVCSHTRFVDPNKLGDMGLDGLREETMKTAAQHKLPLGLQHVCLHSCWGVAVVGPTSDRKCLLCDNFLSNLSPHQSQHRKSFSP